jgi:hypothetical protein
VMRNCVEQDSTISSLRMQPDYLPYSINQKVQVRLSQDNPFINRLIKFLPMNIRWSIGMQLRLPKKIDCISKIKTILDNSLYVLT